MPFHIRDPETDILVRELARTRGIGLTEAVKLAVSAELKRDESATPVRERIRQVQQDVAALPRTGLMADKAFFDDLSGDD
ncbi:MAG TPA: type II toxin-antitoxin system VapB family antitoxin [Caulobacteraceae bacterium]|jgi:antitoxin VapB|nr:type II toxin-antitoxin system VapB family antitoxin [Caulobacteraceae bacterium]